LNQSALFELEQKYARSHVFELACGVAPVPEPGQTLAYATAAPVRMPDQKLAHLRQFNLADGPALNDRMLEHGREYAQETARSLAQDEEILRARKPAQVAPEIT